MLDIPYALPEGTLLTGDFRIGRVLGAGGFGITYRATDVHLKRDVAIKEYFPKMFAHREGGTGVRATSGGGKADYEWGLDRFLQEAQMLAQLKHPNVVGVSRYFRENNTAYLVLELLKGEDFETSLKRRKTPMDQGELDALALPVLDALELVHENGILHRDIKPANIYIREEDGAPVLIDFGASRHSMGEHTGTTAAIASPGYSPSESYSGKVSHQGPWSDIYGLAATLYRAITGEPPTDAAGRLIEDDYAPLAGKPGLLHDYRAGFLAAIDTGLIVAPKQRPQSVAAFRDMLFSSGSGGAETVAAARTAKAAVSSNQGRDTSPAPARAGGGGLKWAAAAILVIALTAGAWFGLQDGGSEARAWKTATDANTAESYSAYLAEWPDGEHAQNAQEKIRELEIKEASAKPRENNSAKPAPASDEQLAQERREQQLRKQQEIARLEQERRQRAEDEVRKKLIRQEEQRLKALRLEQERLREERERQERILAEEEKLAGLRREQERLQQEQRARAGAHQTIRSFLIRDYLGSSFTEAEIRRLYATQVNYWKSGITPIDRIVREKLAYVKRWPVHNYTMRESTLSITPLSPGEQTYSVYYQYDYDLSSGGKRASGTGETNLVVKLVQGRPVIVAEGGKVLQRN